MKPLQFNYRLLLTMLLVSGSFLMNTDAAFGQVVCSACQLNSCTIGAVATGACAFSAGESAQANASNSICIGYKSETNGTNSLSFGNLLGTSSGASNSLVFGSGESPGTLFNNGISNSIMMGINSNLPTMFIESATGSGTWGNVGIGTTSPQTQLHVMAMDGAGSDPVARFSVDGIASSFLQLKNTDSNTGRFASSFTAKSNSEIKPALQFIADNSEDGAGQAGVPIIEFDCRASGGAPSNRPLIYFRRPGANGVKMMIDKDGNVGIGTTSPGYKLDVQGTGASNIHINTNGKMQATEFVVSSDQMFKNQVETIENALTLIDQFTPRNYYYDTLNFNGAGKFNFGSEKQYGFIAQEVEQILPELVHRSIKPAFTDSLGNVLIDSYEFRALNYTALIPILTKGIQELRFEDAGIQQELVNLQNQVDQLTLINNELQEQMQELTVAVNACCGQTDPSFRLGDFEDNDSEVKQTQVTLSDKKFVVLEQNIPNPFAERTTINYIVPSNATDSRILFHDSSGRQIQSVAIETGKDSIDVFASDLSSGTYTYTLVVDGKVTETKKMTKSN